MRAQWITAGARLAIADTCTDAGVDRVLEVRSRQEGPKARFIPAWGIAPGFVVQTMNEG